MSRAYSLRVRVAAATALGAAIIVIAFGFLVARAIKDNNLRAIDQRLADVSGVAMLAPDLAVLAPSYIPAVRSYALTVRVGDDVATSTSVELPKSDLGYHTVFVDGSPYRVITVLDPQSRSVTLGVPSSEATDDTTRQQRIVIASCVAAIAAAAGLGWIFGGRAVRPIIDLTRRISADPPQPLPKASGVREARALADALGSMLQRVTDAQADTTAALTTARDFAAVSAHELRTPLTAMRTDIEVLRTLELDDEQRAEILDDLQRAQGRVEATLSALERLATGELASESDYTDTDIVDVCDLAAQDAMRHYPGLTVRVDTGPSLMLRGLRAGLRLAIDNALTNAARHGGARTAVITAVQHPSGAIVVAIDDDGKGIPEEERAAVFERFVRGSGAAQSGSGLGLALVAQQAHLHGGRAYFETSSLGGARLVIELASRRP